MRARFNIDLSSRSGIADAELRDIFASLGMEPTDMPGAEVEGNTLTDFLVERAIPVLDRMSGATQEEKLRKKRVEKSLIYWSILPATNTQFIVSREIGRTLTFRLINDKLGSLQRGCENLLQVLGVTEDWFQGALKKIRRSPKYRFCLSGDIEVYEHGLATPTIQGRLVKSKLRYALENSKKDLVVASGALILFVVAVAATVADLVNLNSRIAGHIDRFTTAMLTTVIVSGYGILHLGINVTPPVEWITHYND